MRSTNYLIAIVFVSSLVTSCASMKYNSKIQKSQVDYPQLYEKVTAYTGDHLIVQGTALTSNVLLLKESIDGICYDVPLGSYVQVGEDESSLYFDGNHKISGTGCGIPTGLMVEKGKVCVINTEYESYCYKADFDINKVTVADSNSYQRSIVYLGCQGKQLNFSYIEGIGNQATTIPFTFNAEKDSEVVFKGARIKILSYDQTKIEYMLLENFPDRS